jgi:signal transduction histidine kinase
MILNVKILAASMAAVLNLVLIVFVSLRNRRHIVYRSFLLISFCLLMWNLRVIISGLAQLHSNDSFYAVLITQIFYPMVSVCLYILPAAVLQFTVSFIESESKFLEYLVKAAFLMAFVLSFLYVSELISNWSNDPIFWSFFMPIFLISVAIVARTYQRSTRPLARTRLLLLLIAGTIGVAGAIAEDILVASNIGGKGLGNIANATYSLLVAICLFSHRLFDVNITVRRITSFAFVSLIVVSAAFITSALLRLTTPMPYVYVFIAVLVLLLFGHKLVTFIENTLFKRSTFIYQTIDDIRRTLDKAQNITELLKLSCSMIKQNLGVARCLFVTFDDVTHRYQTSWPPNTEDVQTDRSRSCDSIVKWLAVQRTTEPLIYDEIRHRLRFGDYERKLNKEMAEVMTNIENTGYEVCLPLLSETRLEGMVMLGEKVNRHAFTDGDVRFMKLLAYNCTLWIQRIRMIEKIGQLEVLAGLGEMAAYLAHEVKNPLTVIRSSAQLMKSGHRKRGNVDMIVQECDRLSRVVTKMLNFSKTPRPDPQCIDLENTITQWVNEIKDARQSDDPNIVIDVNTKVTQVVFDPDHLKQVFTNLFLNAIEAMQGHGKIRITLAKDRNMMQLAISDTGPGIQRREQSNIFKLFYSTKPAGTGLGLPITRRLVEANKGTMDIESKVGEGCTVKIRLPIWRAKV